MTIHEKVSIVKISGRQVLDSRANPTVEAEVILSDGSFGRAMVPSGASTGAFEAVEKRDGGELFAGKGVKCAVDAVNGEIAGAVVGMDALDQHNVDRVMIALDGTANKSRLGANAILAASLATAKAAARSVGLPLYRYVGGTNAATLPVPMMNVLNGGRHADNGLMVQEFMLLPSGAECFSQAVEYCVRAYHSLKAVLKERGLSTALGDEGGFAPDLARDEDAIELLLEACDRVKLLPKFEIALDAAASEFVDKNGLYTIVKGEKPLTSRELIDHWDKLSKKYPIASIEDGLSEEDWQGWRELTERLGGKIRLVGDDLFVTNVERLARGIKEHAGNALLVKVNQIGTLTEAMDAVYMAHKNGYTCVMSHRSGETEDTTIADLAVATNCGRIKTGAPARTERTAKYNRLLRIEEALGSAARFE